MTEAALTLDRIGQIAIPVDDLDAAIAFYRDVLRVPFLFRAPNLAFFQAGEVRLMLGLPEGEQQGPRASSVIYYRVDDIQAAYAEMGARGAAFVDAPHMIARLPDREVWMFFLKDPAGNLLGVMSEPPIGPG